MVKDSQNSSGCPCTLVEPCSPRCTCANPHYSGGCSRCATYGSKEQRIAAAKRLTTPSVPAEKLIELKENWEGSRQYYLEYGSPEDAIDSFCSDLQELIDDVSIKR